MLTELGVDTWVGIVMLVSILYCLLQNTSSFKNDIWELPWWSGGKESAFQCRGRGFDLWPGN